jgi:hypothetical protein
MVHWPIMDDARNTYTRDASGMISKASHASRDTERVQDPPCPVSCFPPHSSERDVRTALTRCLRLLGTEQDTGGFFIAVFERDTDTQTESLMEMTVIEPSVELRDEASRKASKKDRQKDMLKFPKAQ